jgi:uncharacterized damage-inducible protein DinB
MQKTKWFDRKFPPIADSGLLPAILERLEGTPARIEEIIGNSNRDILEIKTAGKWSIKEEVGHLSDLEPLWIGRMEDFVRELPELRPADLSNEKTEKANHNAADVHVLLKRFREQRQELVKKMRGLNDAQLQLSALHPRLKTPMRMVDHAFFVAEHDDHHIAHIREIILNHQ